MTKQLSRIVVGLTLLAMTAAIALADRKSDTVTFEKDTMVNGTLVKSGTYKVQFDYKTEAACDASRIAVKAQHEDAAAQSWCVPIPKPEKAAKAKPKKRTPVRSAKQR